MRHMPPELHRASRGATNRQQKAHVKSVVVTILSLPMAGCAALPRPVKMVGEQSDWRVNPVP